MIHCLYIKVSHNSRGVPVRSYHTLSGDELTLGRGAECRMHLPDPRIAMHHAAIKRMDDGQIHLVALNGEVEVEGAIQQNVVLTHGKMVMIGPYRLIVEAAPPDVNLAVSLELAYPLPDDYQDLKSRTHEPLPGAAEFKRRLSLALVLLIALVFLILPLAQIFSAGSHAKGPEWLFKFDRLWNPGRISTGHQHFGAQCDQCHQMPTRQVTDQACQRCHRDTTPHIADPVLQQHAFKSGLISTGGKRCAECHREHKAPTPLVRQDNAPCVKCHGNMRAVDAVTPLPDIHDFDRDHPGFKLTIQTGPSPQDVERIPQDEPARLVEKSGLKFPHAQHVGLVQGPGGMSDIREIVCTHCHRPEGKEMRFASLSYQRDCASCHADRLEVGPAGATLKLQHGTEAEMFNTLKLQAPGQFSRYAEALKTDGCAYCHEIVESRKGDALPWRVMPMHISQDWFIKARFRHASHRTQQCKSCHLVEQSESSADVAMPDRKSCLRCHAGNRPKHGRIASSCMTCHDFHHEHVASGSGS